MAAVKKGKGCNLARQKLALLPGTRIFDISGTAVLGNGAKVASLTGRNLPSSWVPAPLQTVSMAVLQISKNCNFERQKLAL